MLRVMMAIAFNRRAMRAQPVTGQSMVEFVLVMPILVLILLGGFSFGMGTYEAHMASDAAQIPSMGKRDFADQVLAVDPGTLQSYMNGSVPVDGNTVKVQGTINTGGNLIDSVSVTNVDQYTSIMVGTKSFQPIVDFIPGFTIRVGQVMNRSLLEAATTGIAEVRPADTPWVPGGTPNPPPW